MKILDLRKEIISSLGSKTINEFESAIERIYDETIDGGLSLERDIIDNYSQVCYYIGLTIPDKEYKYISTIYSFRVNLILQDKNIIYYNLGKITSFRGADFTFIKEEYKDRFEYDMLNTKFRNVFLIDLNLNELFVTDIVYGEGCGIGFQPPNERQIMNLLDTYKNINEIRRWLQSSNVEKQIYALYGFYELNKKGYKPFIDDQKMIESILKKKGDLNFCYSCEYMTERIENIVKEEFDFQF
ncbi:hypothetical protein G7050_16860 [Dysgonomonas sp. HDW5A]|uniref:hypothetical protein n=1 Tax=Dysgonomonas sp. HDW5A TaxID=2714926 RepID=UPI00140A6DAE|nr:hypothetical protein [Dysgonomonas sp. HDW5A]QIK61422.1 hypothetical protein G7050_16860 [Dysgonomonas sp. HDW5A]